MSKRTLTLDSWQWSKNACLKITTDDIFFWYFECIEQIFDLISTHSIQTACNVFTLNMLE